MKVFVTGSTGFAGSHLVRVLLNAGHDVTILLRPQSDTWRLEDVMNRVSVLRGSFAQKDKLLTDCGIYSCDAFIHLAWYGVAGCNRFDEKQVTVNVPVAETSLQMARGMGAHTFVSLGSQSEYGKAEGLIDETRPVHPETRYAHAKCLVHEAARAYCEQKDMRLLWFRLFPVYGPMEREPWMIPSLVKQLSEGRYFAMTHGEQIRDYLFVEDAMDAVRMAMEKEAAYGVYNLASGQGVRLKDLALKIRDMMDPDAEIGFGEIPFRDDQSMEIIGDISRLKRDTGWSPSTGLDDGLRMTTSELLSSSSSSSSSSK